MEPNEIPDSLEVFKYPSDNLKKIARNYDFVNDSKKEDIVLLCYRLVGAMKKFGGISIAATQCGLEYRIFVVDTNLLKTYAEVECPEIFINPVITNKSEETIRFKEGCLSYPKCTAWVKRHKTISLSFKNELGEEQKLDDCEGLLSIMIQHEIDHLNGKSLIDVVDSIEREKLYKQINKSRK